jgi:ribosome-associated protein
MDFNDDTEQEGPSKTRRKQEMHELQKLGETLTGFSADKLAKLPLTVVVRNAIAEFKRLPNSRGARRRQLQFIGRLMRDVDYSALLTAIERFPEQRQPTTAPGQPLDELTEQILASGDVAIQTAVTNNPMLERQTLRRFHLEYSRGDDAGKVSVRHKLRKYLADSSD